MYQQAKLYAQRLGLSAMILIGGCRTLTHEVGEFGQNLGTLVSRFHNQPTIDQLMKDPNANPRDYIEKLVSFGPGLFIDPVYGLVYAVKHPTKIGKGVKDTAKGMVQNPLETALRAGGYVLIGQIDNHGGGSNSGGTIVQPLPNPIHGGDI